MSIKRLNDRMKEDYENRNKPFLTRRVPVIIRIDGRAFHSFTKGFNKPFDKVFMNAMKDTMRALCKEIQGCKLGYTQSDEISLLLTDYDSPQTDAWFDYNLEKLVSISASMATVYFNRFFKAGLDDYAGNYNTDYRTELYNAYLKSYLYRFPMFDSRAFNIPKEEVCNYFICRQQDATRNSIQSLGQAYFSQKQLDKKNCSQIQDMLMLEKNVNWNDLSPDKKRGSCCIKKLEEVAKVCSLELDIEEPIYDTKWVLDEDIPIFTQDRGYIENLL